MVIIIFEQLNICVRPNLNEEVVMLVTLKFYLRIISDENIAIKICNLNGSGAILAQW